MIQDSNLNEFWNFILSLKQLVGMELIMIDFFIIHAYFFFLILAAAIFILSGLYAHKTIVKQISFNLSAVFIAFVLYESFLWINSKPIKDKGFNLGTFYEKNNYVESDLLGYKLKGNGVFTSKKYTSTGILVYDVVYTIKNGIRFTPNTNEKSSISAVFLGCSITFGAGVNDAETLPFYFNKFANNKYRVLNYGVPGYGTHQMLALVESQLFRDLPTNMRGNTIVVYSFIPDHIRRCAGYNKWDLHGPRYEISDGKLVKNGNFSKTKKLLLHNEFITNIWNESYTYKNNFSIEAQKASHYDVLRTLEIINRTNNILQQQGIEFIIIVWDQRKEVERIDKEELDYFYNTLKHLKITVFFVSNIVNPEKYENEMDVYSIKNDGHPTPLFYQTVAKYVFNNLVTE